MSPRALAFALTVVACPALLSAACALGTADTGATPGGTDGGGSAVDSASPDVSSPPLGNHDSGSGDGGSTPDAPAVEDSSPPDTGEPVDAPVDTEAPDGAGDAGINDAGVDAAGHDSGVVCAEHGFTGTLVTFDLSSQTGSEATAPATSTATGITSGALGRAPAINPTGGAGSINGDNWGTGTSADPTRYYTFTVTPPSGCTVDVTSLTFDVRASASGPTNGDVATSADGFGAHSAAFAGTSTGTATLSATSAGTLEIRVFGFGATNAGGTFRIRNTLTLGGSLE